MRKKIQFRFIIFVISTNWIWPKLWCDQNWNIFPISGINPIFQFKTVIHFYMILVYKSSEKMSTGIEAEINRKYIRSVKVKKIYGALLLRQIQARLKGQISGILELWGCLYALEIQKSAIQRIQEGKFQITYLPIC